LHQIKLKILKHFEKLNQRFQAANSKQNLSQGLETYNHKTFTGTGHGRHPNPPKYAEQLFRQSNEIVLQLVAKRVKIQMKVSNFCLEVNICGTSLIAYGTCFT